MKTRAIVGAFVVFGWLLGCFVAFAAEAVAPAAPSGLTQGVLDLLNQVLFPVFGGFFLALLSLAVKKLSAKLGNDILVQNQQLLEAVALQGLSWAEERAAAALKHKGLTLTGSDKMDMALGHVLSSLPAVPQERARAVIESLLARTVGVGSTGKEALVSAANVVG